MGGSRGGGGGGGGGDRGSGPPPGILAKMCLSDSWNGTGLILHSIYVKYSHKLKKIKGSKHGDILMVRTGNVDFSCKGLTSIEIRKSKYHIIRRVRFRWDPPLRKISGSALEEWTLSRTTILDSPKLKEFAHDNFEFDENGRVLLRVGKTLWEKEKLLITSNFSFLQCFQKTCTADT